MSRRTFGAQSADVVMVTNANVLSIAPGAVGAAWDSQSGGTQITDLLDSTGTPVTLVTADSYGRLNFSGPDSVSELWMDFSDPSGRYLIQANEVATIVDGLTTGKLNVTGGTMTGALVLAGDPVTALGASTMQYVDAETTRAEAAEATNSTNIGSETTRAQGAEATLTTAVAATNTVVSSHTATLSALAAAVAAGMPQYASQAAQDTAIPSPSDGQQVYRTDFHAVLQYNSALTRWVAQNGALLGETILNNSSTHVVTFTSIPQNWSQLRLEVFGKCTTSADPYSWSIPINVQVNGVTTSAYEHGHDARGSKIISGVSHYAVSLVDGSGGSTTATYSAVQYVRSSAAFIGLLPGESTLTTAKGRISVDFPNYSQAVNAHNWNSTMSSTGGSSTGGDQNIYEGRAFAGVWLPTTVGISSISVLANASCVYQTGACFRLYGIS